MRRWLVHVAGLTAVWVLLWGRLTVANVVGGVLAAALLLAVFPLERREADGPVVVRPLALVRLGAHVVAQLVTSNLAMTGRTLTAPAGLTGTVVACPLRTTSDGVIAAVTGILALSPGTMVVDVERDGPDGGPVVLLIHVLGADEARARAAVAALEARVVAAVGAPDEVAACAAVGEGPP